MKTGERSTPGALLLALILSAAAGCAAGVSNGDEPDGGPSDAGAAADSGTRADSGTDAGGPNDAGAAADAGWVLMWSDEFDGPSGSSPDPSKWVFETGPWPNNNELENYTSRPQNAMLDGGALIITVQKESLGGRNYTSARLKTQGKYSTTFGKVEMRAILPSGPGVQGIWPAFWMLGADIATNPWPACGEIDIMEFVGKTPTLVYGTIHGPGYSGSAGIGKSTTFTNTSAFHTYAIEWESNVVRWYVDDVLYETRTPADLPAGKMWVYSHDFFILLNMAVGGDFPGSPDGTSTYPQRYIIDYVRVYKRP